MQMQMHVRKASFLLGMCLVTWIVSLSQANPRLATDRDGALFSVTEPPGAGGAIVLESHLITDDVLMQLQLTHLVGSKYRDCSVKGQPTNTTCMTVDRAGLQIVPAGLLYHDEMPLVTAPTFCIFAPTQLNRVLRSGAYCHQGGDNQEPLDKGLAMGLIRLFGASSVLDLGAGYGQYVSYLRNHGNVTRVIGYDGQPGISQLTDGLVHQVDLTKVLAGPLVDWTLSIEVGEHIPNQHERVFAMNLVKHARHGVVVSWAHPGQPGTMHVNCRDSAYLVELFVSLGLRYDLNATHQLRSQSGIGYLQSNLHVFRQEDWGKWYSECRSHKACLLHIHDMVSSVQ